MSVVVPVLNDAKVLTDLLDALGVCDGLEVIVVDGGSSDDPHFTCRDHGVAFLRAEAGRANQMRLGVEHAHGEVIWFLHADAGIAPTLLAALGAARASVRWGRFDVRLTGSSPAFRMIEFAMNWRSRLTGICTGDQGIFVSRRLLEAAGGLPDQPLMEDIELSKRLRRLARPRRIAERLGVSSRRWERDGIWRTIWLMWGLRLRYFLGARPEDLHARYYGARFDDGSHDGSDVGSDDG